MNQDLKHLWLLSIFNYVCAGLAALFACIPVFDSIVGLVLVLGPQSFGPTLDHTPALVRLMIGILTICILLLGWTFAATLAYAGRCLDRRRNYTFCLVMAGIACMFMPFGTILGIFSFIVLVRPSVKALFDGATPPAFAA